MAEQNRWQVGGLYGGGLLNGQPFYTQAEIGGPVIPSQYSGPWVDFPIPGLVISEYVPWWSPGCGHSIKFWKVVKECDYTTDPISEVALVLCSICGFCQNVMPFAGYLDPISHAIIIG